MKKRFVEKTGLCQYRRRYLGLALILAVALAIRLYALGSCRFIGTDGGADGVAMLRAGRNLVSGNGYTFQGRPELAHSPLFPLIAGIFWRITGDLELSGLLISTLAGAVSIVPLFFLARRLFNEPTAWVSILIAAVFPPFIFAATEVRLASFYQLIFLITALALYRNAARPGWRNGLLAGAVAALAYLTRPEGLLFLILGAFFLFLVPGWKKRLARIAGSGGGMVIAFVLLSSPYWFFLHRQLGRWSLSARAPVTFIPYFSDDWEKANFRAYADPESVRRQWDEIGGLPGVIREHGDEMIGRFLKNISVIFSAGRSPEFKRMKIPPAAVTLLTAAAAVGALLLVGWKIKNCSWTFRDTFLALLFLPMIPYAFLTDFMTSQKLRYFYPYLSLGIVILSRLLVFFRERIRRWNGGVSGAVIGTAPIILAVSVSALVTFYLIPAKKATVPFEYKLLGVWARENLKGIGQKTVMSHRMGVPFYAGANHVQIYPGDYKEIINYARRSGADYLVVDDWTTTRLRPALTFLLEGKGTADLEYLYRAGFSGRKAILYRFNMEDDR